MKNLSINQKIKKQKIIALMFFTLSFFTLQKTNAAPGIETVSGNLTKNANVIVEGSAFGTKEVAAPFYFNTMENDTIGQMPAGQITNISAWGTTQANNSYSGEKSLEFNYCADANFNEAWGATGYYESGFFVLYNSKHYRCLNTVHSTISPDLDSLNWIEDENLPQIHCNNGKIKEHFVRNAVDFGVTGSDKIFFSRWIYITKKSKEIGLWKDWGIYANPDLYNTGRLNDSTVFNTTPWDNNTATFHGGGNPAVSYWSNIDGHAIWWTNAQQNIPNNAPDQYLWDQWQRIDSYMQQSDPLFANGVAKFERIGKAIPLANYSNLITRDIGGNPWRYLTLSHGITSVYVDYVDFTVYMDDIYIDKTQARIELCDNQTWESRTHCEIQIPISWNNSQIQFTLNQGSFPNGRAYLFVIDENGIPSTGKEINLGQTSTPTSFNISNFTTLLSNWLKKESNNAADLNSDGIINSRDLGIMMGKWN